MDMDTFTEGDRINDQEIVLIINMFTSRKRGGNYMPQASCFNHNILLKMWHWDRKKQIAAENIWQRTQKGESQIDKPLFQVKWDICDSE